jgi:transmembrane sensor
MENKEYIEKWLNGSLSEEELRVFEKTNEYNSIIRLDNAVQGFKAPYFDLGKELEQLNQQKKRSGKVVQMNWLQPLLRVAAVVTLALIGYYFIFFNAKTSITTGIAQKTELYLPDESSVMLNALSNISYSEKKWQDNRHVNLTGEAFFKVAKGSRFDVETVDGIISVLGTQFNVKAREGYFEVICFEGLVAVKVGQKIVELPPDNMFRIINGETSTSSSLIDASPSWLRNESSFKSVPFKLVLEEVERQYDVSITSKNIDLEQLFTGRFTHDNLSLALNSISLPLNLQFKELANNKIELSSEIK